MKTFSCLAGFLLVCILAAAPRLGAATFLFDNTKAETASNADWVLDADNGTTPRFPTPAASGIIASTPETYWKGALSAWGVALVKLGHSVETLPTSGRITYLDSTNAQDLSKYQVYVVCEPNILFTTAQKTAIARFVQDGGSLFVISDHADSDRNNDGYDSVEIWNDFFKTNGVQANPFGVAINSNSVNQTSTTVDTLKDDPLITGPNGSVTSLEFNAGATLTINTAANASVRAAVWSSTSRSSSSVMMAYGTFGKGRFTVIGDSSPSDDGTGNSGNDLYQGWTDQGGNHSRIFLNASVWLAANVIPANDLFANATVIPYATANANVVGKNIDATSETGEPVLSPDRHSVWWKWTPTANQITTVSTSGSDFDTVLGVYTGSAVNALTLVASNDNAGSGSTSQVSFYAQSGVTYSIAVVGNATNSTGNISLGLSHQSLPTVSIAATTAVATEKNQTSGIFNLTLNAASALAIDVRVDLSGTASAANDYSTTPATSGGIVFVRIPAGQTSATIALTPLLDNDPTEGDETATATVSAGTGYQINSSAATANVVIRDDSPYSAAWENSYRQSGFSGSSAAPNADFDGDGLSNFTEFAFNLSPIFNDAPRGLPVVGSGVFVDTADNASHHFATVTFTRRTDAPNLGYTVEAVGDLSGGSWSAENVIFVSSSTTDMPPNTERAIYRSTQPQDGPRAVARQFLRVRAVATPP